MLLMRKNTLSGLPPRSNFSPTGNNRNQCAASFVKYKGNLYFESYLLAALSFLEYSHTQNLSPHKKNNKNNILTYTYFHYN